MSNELTREQLVEILCERIQDLYPHMGDKGRLLVTYDALRTRLGELEEWKRIVTGAGTDQESVIRLAAVEYTRTTAQCWREHTAKLDAQLDEQTKRAELQIQYNAELLERVADLTAKLASTEECLRVQGQNAAQAVKDYAAKLKDAEQESLEKSENYQQKVEWCERLISKINNYELQLKTYKQAEKQPLAQSESTALMWMNRALNAEQQLASVTQERDRLLAVIGKQQFSIEHLSEQHTKQSARATQLQATVTAQGEEIERMGEAIKRVCADTLLDQQEAGYYRRIMLVWKGWIRQALASGKETI